MRGEDFVEFGEDGLSIGGYVANSGGEWYGGGEHVGWGAVSVAGGGYYTGNEGQLGPISGE